jgi:hypothetical protein
LIIRKRGEREREKNEGKKSGEEVIENNKCKD